MTTFENLQDNWDNFFYQVPFFFLSLGLKATQMMVLSVFYTYDYLAYLGKKRGYKQRRPFTPSVNWIAENIGMSKPTAIKVVSELREMGFLRQEGETANGKRKVYHVDLDAINDALRENAGLKKLETPDTSFITDDGEEWNPFGTVMLPDQYRRQLSDGKAREPH